MEFGGNWVTGGWCNAWYFLSGRFITRAIFRHMFKATVFLEGDLGFIYNFSM